MTDQILCSWHRYLTSHVLLFSILKGIIVFCLSLNCYKVNGIVRLTIPLVLFFLDFLFENETFFIQG